MPASLLLNGESRGRTQTHDAMIGDADMALLGIDTTVDAFPRSYQADTGNSHK
jgi:hypothetical protein